MVHLLCSFLSVTRAYQATESSAMKRKLALRSIASHLAVDTRKGRKRKEPEVCLRVKPFLESFHCDGAATQNCHRSGVTFRQTHAFLSLTPLCSPETESQAQSKVRLLIDNASPLSFASFPCDLQHMSVMGLRPLRTCVVILKPSFRRRIQALFSLHCDSSHSCHALGINPLTHHCVQCGSKVHPLKAVGQTDSCRQAAIAESRLGDR